MINPRISESRPHLLTGALTVAVMKVLDFFENRKSSKGRDAVLARLEAFERRIATLEERIYELLKTK